LVTRCDKELALGFVFYQLAVAESRRGCSRFSGLSLSSSRVPVLVRITVPRLWSLTKIQATLFSVALSLSPPPCIISLPVFQRWVVVYGRIRSTSPCLLRRRLRRFSVPLSLFVSLPPSPLSVGALFCLVSLKRSIFSVPGRGRRYL